VGNFGKVGDVLGGIGDKLGATNYSGTKPATPSPTRTKARPAVIKPAKSSSSSPSKPDLPGNAVSRALNVGAGKKDKTGNYAGKANDGCVIATHAVESGAFSPRTKREAIVWCMDVLHGKWWGEAIRRGYRYCGTKKIEQGKAREHYGRRHIHNSHRAILCHRSSQEGRITWQDQH
jgi:hypothetical protein